MKENLNMQQLTVELSAINRGYMSASECYQKTILTTYMAYKLKIKGFNMVPPTLDVLATIIEDDGIRQFVLSRLENVNLSAVAEMCKYESDVLADYIVNAEVPFDRMGPETITPQGIIKLALALMEVRGDDSVLDACSGFGNFLVESKKNNPCVQHTGIEENVELAMISRIRFEVLGNPTKVIERDLFSSEIDGCKFSKIFSNYPFGIKVKQVEDSEFWMSASADIPALTKMSNSDWLFNYRIVKLLEENGKAVAIMAMGGLWNTRDKHIRKFFVENGFVEAIIALPPKLFTSTNANTAMIVFGKNSGSVKMIDAHNIFTNNRRMNILVDSDVEQIISAYNSGSPFTKDVSLDKIADSEYSLDPQKYLSERESVTDGVEFRELVSSITRGAPITASELDQLATAEDTNCYYLTLANIKDGMITDDLTPIREIDKRYEKYCIKDGDILLSKNGQPFKVTVASIKNDEKILATGNLFIITVDRTKVNPYYIKAFLDSTAGVAELKSITVGSTIPTIGISQLNTIRIPMISLEKQEELAKKYIDLLHEIDLLQKAVADKTASLRAIFSN